jgi:hypothetical protein
MRQGCICAGDAWTCRKAVACGGGGREGSRSGELARSRVCVIESREGGRLYEYIGGVRGEKGRTVPIRRVTRPMPCNPWVVLSGFWKIPSRLEVRLHDEVFAIRRRRRFFDTYTTAINQRRVR